MKKPNILLLMPDQMRGDCLSLEHHPALQTPHMDAIGHNGTHFTRGYTTCASCIPARRALLTGQSPASNGMVGYKEGYPLLVPTVTECLRDAGYQTMLAGRAMHQTPKDHAYGFERRVLGSTYINDDDYAKHFEAEVPELGGIAGIGLSCNGRDVKAWPVADELHPSHWTVQQSRRLIAESDADRPSFLVASFYAPHPPLFPPARYLDMYLGMDLPPAALGDGDVAPPRASFEDNVDASRVDLNADELRLAQAGYYGLIKQIDDLLPDLLAEFKDRSEAEGRPWVVVFTSDHGDMMGDHYLFRKCEPYEGASRVPFLIEASPALGFAAGNRCSSPVCLEDLMPTLLGLAGAPVPSHVDGRSLLPILRGDSDAVRGVLHAEHATCYDTEQAYHFLTDGRMKYIWRPGSGREQFFNLDADPQELNELSTCADRSGELRPWRNHLIDLLKGRPEGFTDGKRLIAGREYPPVLPHAKHID